MQLHQVRPKTRLRKGQRIGRGGKRGTTAGRGTKGQKARAGHKIRPALRDIIKKLPKRRGYRFRRFRTKPAVVDLAVVAKRFSAGDTVDAAALLRKGLVSTMKGKIPPMKILGNIEIKKKLVIRGLALSQSARARVEAAGGSVS